MNEFKDYTIDKLHFLLFWKNYLISRKIEVLHVTALHHSTLLKLTKPPEFYHPLDPALNLLLRERNRPPPLFTLHFLLILRLSSVSRPQISLKRNIRWRTFNRSCLTKNLRLHAVWTWGYAHCNLSAKFDHGRIWWIIVINHLLYLLEHWLFEMGKVTSKVFSSFTYHLAFQIRNFW